MRGAVLIVWVATCSLVLSAVPAGAQVTPPTAAEVARGRYVFGATGGCGCHTLPKGQANAGGRKYEGAFGTVYSTNITPDQKSGIGGWTDEQSITAIRPRRRPDGGPVLPVDPFPVFHGMA